jgi:hypothetical protein
MNNHKFVSSTMTTPFKSSLLILLSLVLLLTGCSSNKPDPDPDPEPEPEPVVIDPMAYMDEKTGEAEISPGVTVDLQEFKQKEWLLFYFIEPFTTEEINEMFEEYSNYLTKRREFTADQNPNDSIQTDFMGMKQPKAIIWQMGDEMGDIVQSIYSEIYKSKDPVFADYKRFCDKINHPRDPDDFHCASPGSIDQTGRSFDFEEATEIEKRYTVIWFRLFRSVYLERIYPKLGITYKCDLCDEINNPD